MTKKEYLYQEVLKFKEKYPLSIAWRLKRHCEVVFQHLNDDEEILYAFAAQRNDNPLDIITTSVVALTNKRIVIGQKRLLFGYMFFSITPDMFNDLTVKMGIIWGRVYIDTIKELVCLSNIQKDALIEIENKITEYMMEEKKKYVERPNQMKHENI